MPNWRQFIIHNPDNLGFDGLPELVNMDLVFVIAADPNVEGVVTMWPTTGMPIRVKAKLHEFIDQYRPTQIGG